MCVHDPIGILNFKAPVEDRLIGIVIPPQDGQGRDISHPLLPGPGQELHVDLQIFNAVHQHFGPKLQRFFRLVQGGGMHDDFVSLRTGLVGYRPQAFHKFRISQVNLPNLDPGSSHGRVFSHHLPPEFGGAEFQHLFLRWRIEGLELCLGYRGQQGPGSSHMGGLKVLFRSFLQGDAPGGSPHIVYRCYARSQVGLIIRPGIVLQSRLKLQVVYGIPDVKGIGATIDKARLGKMYMGIHQARGNEFTLEVYGFCPHGDLKGSITNGGDHPIPDKQGGVFHPVAVAIINCGPR